MNGYRYRPREEEIEARRRGAMDVLAALVFGVAGALVLFYGLSS